MRRISITEAKNNLSVLIDSVKSGTSVLILDRGRPVARLPIAEGDESDDEWLGRLVREGIVRRGRGRISAELLSEPPPRLEGSVSALEVLLDERREGR